MVKGEGGVGKYDVKEVKHNKELYRQLEDILKSLQFGSVTLVVQNGHVIQIETNEKIRLK